MLGFKKTEIGFLVIFIFVVALVTKLNLIDSYRKSRDVTRKNDLGDIMNRLDKFKERLGFYPASTDDGKILGCEGFVFEDKEWVFKPCNWGENPVNSPYFDRLPTDPRAQDGYTYRYISDGVNYQVFVRIEGSREDEYDEQIVARNLMCGTVICSAGRTNLSLESLHHELPKTDTLN